MNRHLSSASTTPRSRCAANRCASGFSLIELMVVIAIAAILTGLAGPSILRMLSSNRVQSEASSFVSDLMYARSEAIKHGQSVSLCASSDGGSCLASGAWGSGWIVYYDTSACGTLPSTTSPATTASTTQTLLRVRAAFKGSDTLAGASTKTCVSFNREGFGTNLGTSRLLFTLHTSPASTQTTRCVAIDLGGRVSTLTTADSSCT